MAFTKINFANASPRGTGDGRLASVPAKARHFNDLVDHLTTGQVVLSGGGATVLTAANSGATCVFDTAAASTFTLPAPVLGMRFHFISAITATGDHEIIAGSDGHGFLGGVTFTQLTSTAADQCDSFSAHTGGANDYITMNGSTTGGVAGSYLTCIAILGTSAAKTWAVHGSLIGTGNTATPFANS